MLDRVIGPAEVANAKLGIKQQVEVMMKAHVQEVQAAYDQIYLSTGIAEKLGQISLICKRSV